jgi:hypothetical protein
MRISPGIPGGMVIVVHSASRLKQARAQACRPWASITLPVAIE